jgi:flagellar P-ring protein precursor FlgI
VTITERAEVSQPNAFGRRQHRGGADQRDQPPRRRPARMFKFDPGTSLDEHRAPRSTEVGAAPGDLVAILEALREAGALRAELIVI